MAQGLTTTTAFLVNIGPKVYSVGDPTSLASLSLIHKAADDSGPNSLHFEQVLPTMIVTISEGCLRVCGLS